MKPLCAALAAVLAAVLLLAADPPPAGAADVDLSYFKGSITDVGIQRGPGQVGGVEFRIEGEFSYDGPIDLSRSTLVLHELFVEEGGAGELMTMMDDAGFLPFSLITRSSSEPDEAKYGSPSRFRPQMRMQIENNQGEWEFKFKLDRGLMRRIPQRCTVDPVTRRSYTFITHSFSLSDGANPELVVRTTRRWECVNNLQGYQMRSR
jgi:hypothetical protein